MSKITINTELCKGCGQCVKDCGVGIIKIENGKAVISEESKNNCMGCGHCVAVCKSQAITIFNQPTEALPEDDSLISIMKRRRAIRQYKSDLIPQEEIREMLNVTKYSASGCNFRPIKFLVLSGEKFNEFIEYALKVLKDINDGSIPPIVKAFCEAPNGKEMFTRGSPHAVFAYGTTDKRTGEYAFDDAVIQLTQFELVAVQRGYGTLWSAMLKTVMNLPGVLEHYGLKDVKCYHALNLGIPSVKYHNVASREDVDVLFI